MSPRNNSRQKIESAAIVASIHPPKSQNRYDNHEWVAMLSGLLGEDAQQQAHHTLKKYLFGTIRNFLRHRKAESAWLAGLDQIELTALTEDFVQICLVKLSLNNYALLEQFSGEGTFTAWAAQVALNEARSELRKVRWNRLRPLYHFPNLTDTQALDLEAEVQRQHIAMTLADCLEQLSESHRIVITRCLINGERAADVAKDLKRTAQAVYNLTHRAKEEMKVLLMQADVGPDDLPIFMG